MNPTRRDILKQGAGTAALCALGPVSSLFDKKIPVGLQLYSVRRECGKDLPGVLKAVAAMGYKGVEFAGYYKKTAKEMRKLLDDNGLVCCGTHTNIKTLEGDALEETIEFNRTLGNKYLIAPSLPKQYLASAEACRKTGKLFTDMAAKAKSAGMVVGYHAHAGDFKEVDGKTKWDHFFGNAGPGVVMQLDTGNCLGGGGDPVAVLKRFPGRSLTIHLKEHGGPKGAPIGEGDVKWKEIFEICETVGKTEWYIVEHESGKNPIESVKACFENLKKMGKA